MVEEPEGVPAGRDNASLEDALYRIADMASAASDLPETDDKSD